MEEQTAADEVKAVQDAPLEDTRWALILGVSSGFGAAAALALAEAGFNICGLYLGMSSKRDSTEELKTRIAATGPKVAFFRANAANPEKRKETLDAVARQYPGAGFRVLLHSLAFGSLAPLFSEDGQEALDQKQMEMTLDVMANSLVYWAQDMVARNMLRRGSRILSLTSAGSTHAWPNYGAVSAAKAALEAHTRQLAMELAPRGITSNTILAGVTDTPALRKIPGASRLVAGALARNPSHRLTTAEDVARFIVMWAGPGSQWATGNVLLVDGGETIAG